MFTEVTLQDCVGKRWKSFHSSINTQSIIVFDDQTFTCISDHREDGFGIITEPLRLFEFGDSDLIHAGIISEKELSVRRQSHIGKMQSGTDRIERERYEREKKKFEPESSTEKLLESQIVSFSANKWQMLEHNDADHADWPKSMPKQVNTKYYSSVTDLRQNSIKYDGFDYKQCETVGKRGKIREGQLLNDRESAVTFIGVDVETSVDITPKMLIKFVTELVVKRGRWEE